MSEELFSDISAAAESVLPSGGTETVTAPSPATETTPQPQENGQGSEAAAVDAVNPDTQSTEGAAVDAPTQGEAQETPVVEGATPEAPVPTGLDAYGGEEFVKNAVALYEGLAGAEFNGSGFLSSLYEQSPARYSELIAEIVNQHPDDISRFLFGVDSQTLKNALQSGRGTPEQINEVAAHFKMSQDDFDLLPEATQESLKESYKGIQEAQRQAEAQAQQQRVVESQRQFEDWRVGCNAQIGKTLDTLGVKDPDVRSDIEAMTYGALNSDPATQKLFNDILQHLNNGEYNLAKSLTPKLHTHLASIAAKKAAKDVELGKLRTELDTLKRQYGLARKDVDPGASSTEQKVPTNNPTQNYTNVFDIGDIKSQLDTIKRGTGSRV